MLNHRTRLLPLLFLIAGLFIALHAQDQFFDSSGVKIHYAIEGKGEPVILIHGFGSNSTAEWGRTGIIKGLSGSYQVIAIDDRGHGQSDKPHDAAAYEGGMVDDVIRLMDHLKIAKAHVVGYSMGGILTEIFLTEHPDRLLTATLGGAVWSGDGGDRKILDRTADSIEQGNGIAPLIVGLNPVGAPPLTPQQIEATNKSFLASHDPLAMAAVARGLAHSPPVPDGKIRANKIAVLAMVGELDPGKSSFDRLQAMMPNLRLVVIPGAIHQNALANPLFLSNLQSFLAEHQIEKVQATGK